MRRILLVVLPCFVWFSCPGPSGTEECTPIADNSKEVELVSPLNGSFHVGQTVEIAWKMNPKEVSQVSLQLSTSGESGPWRDVFSRGISTDNLESEFVCMDTIWQVGNEYAPIDFSSTQSVLLRVTKYLDQGTDYVTDVSNTITISP
jgi:hypothetical protein